MKSKIAVLNVAGISGAICVALASFGAHGLEKILDDHAMDVFNIGIRYHMYHTLAMLAVAVMMQDTLMESRVSLVCWLWLSGIIVFSGSLYLLAVTNMKWLGMITPIGGVLLIIGWLSLVRLTKVVDRPSQK